MFVELLEKLRCPNEHDPSPLIATATRTEHRRIIEGTLGCPVCHAEFVVRDGALMLGGPEAATQVTPEDFTRERTDDLRTRMAAQLGLDERAGLYVLSARGSSFASDFLALSPNSQFIGTTRYGRVEGCAGVFAGLRETLPLAAGCARGIVLDSTSPGLLRSAALVLAPEGRLVAPASAPVPAGVRELARDAEEWVGERERTPEVGTIRRAGRQPLPG